MHSIICADSSAAMRAFYKEVLAEHDYDVHVAKTAQSALKQFRKHPADAVILAVEQPELDGLQVCAEIRQMPGGEGVPILVTTEDYNEFILLEGLNMGADDCLVKPFKPLDVLSKLFVLLRKRAEWHMAPPASGHGPLFADTYEIIKVLGRGGFSVVYLAKDTKRDADSCMTALKVYRLADDQLNDENYMSYFLREAYEMSRLDHPNIARFYDFGKADDTYYLAMEYIQGRSLLDQVDRRGPLPEEQLLVVAYEMAQALEYMEKRQIVHRDIKPNNVLLSKKGDVKLVDFGLAKHQQDMSITDHDEQFRGTPEYVSPEMIRGEEEIDSRSDVYSFGATLYFAATGAPPFTGDAPMDVILANLETEPPPLNQVAGMSDELSTIVEWMMAKDPEHRLWGHQMRRELFRLMERYERSCHDNDATPTAPSTTGLRVRPVLPPQTY